MAHESGIPSAAQISGHPIHPLLIPFPIAYLVGALLTDIAYLVTQDPFWARASLWLIGAGLVMGAAAAIFRLTDFLARPAIRQYGIAWHHFIGNATVLILAAINLYFRMDTSMGGLALNGIVLSLITVGILSVGAGQEAQLCPRRLSERGERQASRGEPRHSSHQRRHYQDRDGGDPPDTTP